jgi:NADP-dependent aldehyde dehydrogenase
MLYAGLRDSYEAAAKRFAATAGVKIAGQSRVATNAQKTQAAPMVFTADAKTFIANPAIHEELFGPATLLITGSRQELTQIAASLEGHLTATLQATPQDMADHRELIAILERKVGRLLFNGFPTGVEVCPAMQHGGPYPATTDARTTSVGTAAIERFARPICYQDFPPEALPEELRDGNPRGIWRMVDGQMQRKE